MEPRWLRSHEGDWKEELSFFSPLLLVLSGDDLLNNPRRCVEGSRHNSGAACVTGREAEDFDKIDSVQPIYIYRLPPRHRTITKNY